MLEPTSAAPAAYNPDVQRVLKSFQSSAEASLSGPSRFMAGWGREVPQSVVGDKRADESLYEFRKAMMSASLDKKTSTSDGGDELRLDAAAAAGARGAYFPVPHVGPLLLPMDSSHSEKSETLLEGVTISCFVVGGEKRLCLPQILKTVLHDFSLREINAICDELHIFCSRCNPQQLELLKVTGILPPNAPSCGLITKTDAERLCNALLYGSPETSREPATPNSFKVYHECFGKCKGVLSPELYADPEAKCIKCCHCHGMFSPQKFVVHSHRALENRTCHWGFDSANWRAYILLAKDQDAREHMQRALDEIKDKFDYPAVYKKRREHLTVKPETVESKRARYDENGTKDFDTNGLWPNDYVRGMSAFRPWPFTLATLLKEGKLPAVNTRDGYNQLLPSYLQTGPPVLLNPERVVPFTDTKRYDRHFAPNVSLAPHVGKDEIKGEVSPNTVDRKHLSSASSCTPPPPKPAPAAAPPSPSVPSSPSPVKAERTSDAELSSSDDSNRQESLLASPGRDYSFVSEVEVPLEEDLAADRKKLFSLVQQALDTTAGGSDGKQELILKQVADICSRQENIIHVLKQDRQQLAHEFDKLRRIKQEHLEEVTNMRLLMKQLQTDLDTHTQQLNLEKQRLLEEVEQARVDKQRLAREVEQTRADGDAFAAKIKAKYKGQIEMLRARVEEYEEVNTNMAAQINTLKEQLQTLEADSKECNTGSHTLNKRHNGTFTSQSEDLVKDSTEPVDKKVTSDTTLDEGVPVPTPATETPTEIDTSTQVVTPADSIDT